MSTIDIDPVAELHEQHHQQILDQAHLAVSTRSRDQLDVAHALIAGHLVGMHNWTGQARHISTERLILIHEGLHPEMT